MIRIFITALIYLIGLFTQAQEPSQLEHSLESNSARSANVTDLEGGKGTIDVTCYLVEEDFVNRTCFQTNNIKEEENRLTMAFEHAPFNMYEVSDDWDKNNKGKREFDINIRPD